MADALPPRVLIYNKSNVLQDIPGDVISVTCANVVNGGAADATIIFPRQFNALSAFGEGYRVQIFLPGDYVNPYWDGRISEIDAKPGTTNGRIEIRCEGWQTALDDAIATFTMTPGVQPNGVNNGQEDYGAFISWMLNLYQPTGFTNVVPGSAGVNVPGYAANHEGVGRALDAITKSILDSSAAHWEWYVDGTAALGKVITVQPVSVNQLAPISLDQLSDLFDYDLRVSYKAIKNMLVLYGGTDVSTGEQVWGPFTNASSIASYGLRQFSTSVSQLVNQSQLQQYATAQLNLLGSPTYSGTFKVQQPTSKIRAGKWVSVLEPGIASVRSLRLARVQVAWTKGARIEMTCDPTAAIPNIDLAIQDSTAGAAAVLRSIAARPATSALSGISGLLSGGQIVSFA